MAEITEELLDNLTRLCRIACPAAEKEKLLVDLKQIVDYIEQLSEVDTTGVEECNHVLGMVNVFREDEVGEELPRETFLGNAPDQVDGLIRVPEVIKKRS